MSNGAKRIKEYCDAASKGPWEWRVVDASLMSLVKEGESFFESAVLDVTRCPACQKRAIEEALCMWPKSEDATFIANSRVDLPAVTEVAVGLWDKLERLCNLVQASDLSALTAADIHTYIVAAVEARVVLDTAKWLIEVGAKDAEGGEG